MLFMVGPGELNGAIFKGLDGWLCHAWSAISTLKDGCQAADARASPLSPDPRNRGPIIDSIPVCQSGLTVVQQPGKVL
jgi:hypothetical protein